MLLDRLLRKLIRTGELAVTGPSGDTTHYGAPARGSAPVTIGFTSRAAARRVGINPMLAAGEEFMNGGHKAPDDDILPLLQLVSHNLRWEWGNKARMALYMGQRRSEEHTSELQSLMRISYAVFCL